MKREWLKELGIDEKLIDKIMSQNGEDIENAKATVKESYKEMESENANLNKTIKERDKQLEDIKKQSGDNAELTKQIADMQKTNAEAIKAKDAEIAKIKTTATNICKRGGTEEQAGEYLGDSPKQTADLLSNMNVSTGLKEAAEIKRNSITARVTKMKEIVDESPEDNFILWHDLESERHAIKKALPETVDIYGSQDYEIREKRVIDFSDGRTRLFATKKELSGSGCNFQKYCHREIFVGIDYEFNDFIQAIHRCYRFLQKEQVVIDIIYMENERQIKDALLEKWKNHDYMVNKMTEIVKKYGLNSASKTKRLERKMGVETVRVEGKNYTAVHDDCVEETRRMETNSIDLIHTSIPFGNHYEYSANYNDFGHNKDTERFFEQMDFLTPELLRVLKPGRVAAIHVKDRVLFGNATGTGMPTIEPFHAQCIEHYMKHGFRYFGMITVVTDVVRENNQTYRLGWSEQCKDGSKMGVESMPQNLREIIICQ